MHRTRRRATEHGLTAARGLLWGGGQVRLDGPEGPAAGPGAVARRPPHVCNTVTPRQCLAGAGAGAGAVAGAGAGANELGRH